MTGLRVLGVLAAALVLAWARPASARAQGAGGEFSDAAIEQRKSELDAAFSQVQLEADKEFQDSVAFHARLKQERLDFERERLTARKQMLDSLRGLPAGGRKAEYDRFHSDDARRRKEFAQRLSQEKTAFRREFLEERHEARREESRRREDASPRRRSR